MQKLLIGKFIFSIITILYIPNTEEDCDYQDKNNWIQCLMFFTQLLRVQKYQYDWYHGILYNEYG